MQIIHTKNKLGIFGGTYEGRLLAEYCQNNGICAVVSVATAYGNQLLQGEVNTGRMNAGEMADWIRQQTITAVVDATHPFAQEASKQIRLACAIAKVEYQRLIRDKTCKYPMEEHISWVSSIDEAASLLKHELLSHPQRRALLTTGSKELACFTLEKSLLPRLSVRVLPSVEAIKACQDAGFLGNQIIAMQGPFSCEINQAILNMVHADYLITKESGQAGGLIEKLKAARLCHCQVIAVRRPVEQGEGKSLEDIKEWLKNWEGKEETKEAKETKRIIPKTDTHVREIVLLGIGMGNIGQITLEGIQALANADALLGARRMVESAKAMCRQMTFLPKQEPITYPLKQMTYQQEQMTYQQEQMTHQQEQMTHQQEQMIDKQERITYKKEEMVSWLNEHPEIVRPVILFSGDTGCYSGAKDVYTWIKDKFPDALIRLIPGISSLSYFASKIGRVWEKTEIVSLHGRKEMLDWRFSDNKERFFLLDGEESLYQICRKLLENGQEEAILWAGEKLSYPDEKIICGTPKELLNIPFGKLLVVWVSPKEIKC